ncbi:MAG: hypothetical protein EAZ66_06515 [Alphaproteobacteria bacterium]|nr:MAG: hypothetical protein EAZ66_06515 [Alphaproteobacteria bacterium]
MRTEQENQARVNYVFMFQQGMTKAIHDTADAFPSIGGVDKLPSLATNQFRILDAFVATQTSSTYGEAAASVLGGEFGAAIGRGLGMIIGAGVGGGIGFVTGGSVGAGAGVGFGISSGGVIGGVAGAAYGGYLGSYYWNMWARHNPQAAAAIENFLKHPGTVISDILKRRFNTETRHCLN